jgi:ferredoxin
MEKIDCYYYSGTGNTFLIVKEMTAVFAERGIESALHRIEDTDPKRIKTKHTIGLGFPVAFQSTFPFLWEFFRSLPQCAGTPIFMVDTMQAFSGAIVGPLRRVLEMKGYHCIGAEEIVMPSSWFPRRIDEEKNRMKLQRGLAAARRYAEALIAERTSWKRIPLLSDAFYHLCCNAFMMQKVNTAAGKRISVDTSLCTKCGLCEKLCPVDNITLDEYPQFHDRCEVCMRCLSFCPVEALYIPDKDFARYRAVKAKDLIGER